MPLPKISLARSMLAIALFALLFTALRYPTPLAAAVAFSIVLFSLTIAAVGSATASGLDRSRCLGFLIAASIAFAVHFLHHLWLPTDPWFATNASADLISQNLTARDDDLGMRMHLGIGPEPWGAWTWAEGSAHSVGEPVRTHHLSSTTVNGAASTSLERTINALSVLLTGLIGLAAAQRFHRRSLQQPTATQRALLAPAPTNQGPMSCNPPPAA